MPNTQKQTIAEYKEVLARCKKLFEQKAQDYGTSWRIMRLPSITDQIFIKAQRIRSIQEKGTQKIEDDISDDFVAIINYSIMAMIQIHLDDNRQSNLPVEDVAQYYQQFAEETEQLLAKKNHDFGEAWRQMRVSSMTDIILMKIYRVKQIEDNKGDTIVSEGVKANYQDMLNYAVFCLIKMNGKEN